MEHEDPNSGGNQRKNLMLSVDAILKRLKTDYIDVLWMHAWDGVTPIEEVMRGLDDVVRSGKVLPMVAHFDLSVLASNSVPGTLFGDNTRERVRFRPTRR